MPTYEYACKDCDEHLEVVQSFKDKALTECPACGGPLRKVFGNIGITFKGSGFYRTDSRSDGHKAGQKSADGAKSGESKTSEAKSGDGSGSGSGSSKGEPSGSTSSSSSSPGSSSSSGSSGGSTSKAAAAS
jgi:putative FmdB family regulatory protein